jgi:O-methyltransferase involved in polyketide biosynthesis
VGRKQVNQLRGVSETLLIPLHFRVEESRSGTSSFKDAMAEQFHDAIDYDWNGLGAGPLGAVQRLGMAARTRILDEQVGRYIATHPEALVVNLGAGLDTRFYRVDNGSISWIELDLPDVIAFRHELEEPPTIRHALLGASVLDEQWVPEVKRYGKQRVLFIAEGLFPYFSEPQHRHVFGLLADNFPAQQMLFQTSAPSVTRELAHESDLTKMKDDVELGWGLEESAQVSMLNEKTRYIGEFSLLAGREQLLPEHLKEKLTPDALRKAGRIVHVRFDVI